MDSSRRRVLRTAGAGLLAALAGCTGGLGGTPTASPSPTLSPTSTPVPDADGDGVSDTDDAFPDDDRRARIVASRSLDLDLEKGAWRAFGLTYDQQGVLSYQLAVTAGPDIDAMVIPRDGLAAFRNREGYNVYPSMTRFNTADASVETLVPKGKYVLILDNTSRGRASPGDGDATTATVEFEFEQSV